MTREIKLKAWDKKHKVMTALVTLKDIQNGFTGLYGPDKIVLEYTGKEDPNGKPICEGDVLNYECDKRSKDGRGNISGTRGYHSENALVVSFDDGMFKLANLPLGSELRWKKRFSDPHVIGNIHENPELLENT